MIEWTYIVLGCCILLFVLLFLKENRRKNQVRLVWRLIASFFAVVGLVFLAIPVTYRTAEKVTASRQAVLLTEGFNPDSVNRFLSANHDLPVFTANYNLKDAGKYNAKYISVISSATNKDINTFHVFGYGLEPGDLETLKKYSIIFHPTHLAAGFTAMHWSQKIKTGDKLWIQGRYNNPSLAKTKIVLSGFNTVLDSIYLSGKDEKFQLTTIPKHAGRTIYTLAVVADKDTVQKEVIPVQVEQGEPISILMLASSPNFENKFLKNELSENGYKVVVRSLISKYKYLKEYYNTPAIPVDRITSSLLDKFDVTIADASSLASISKAELLSIQAQVAQKSMGLIVTADTAVSSSSFYASRFSLQPVAGETNQLLNVYVSDSTGKMPAISTENPLSIRTANNTQPIVFDKHNRVYANSTLYGSGKIILTTLNNTYSWALAGNKTEYNKFWTELLNKAAAKPAAEETWSVSPTLPQTNKPVQLQVQTNNTGITQGQVAGASIYLKNNYDLPFQWSGTFYPVKEGWQSGIQLNGTPFYWYAYNKSNWKNIWASQRIQATEEYILENKNYLKKEEETLQTKEKEVPKIYFFIVFLLSCGYLWLEEKNLLS